ncbi:MAG: hypothetical protein AB1451_06945 [Nitrospirota bacterium]
MGKLVTASSIAPSRRALRRRAGKLAATFGLLIVAVWIVGWLLHQDLLAGLLVVAAIVVGWLLIVTITKLLTLERPTQEAWARFVDWDEERERNPCIPGTKAYWNYGQELLDRDRND